MKDAKFQLTKALPNAAANNTTNLMSLLTEDAFDNKFRLAYVQVAVPALSDHTNTSVTNTLRLRHSQDNNASNLADVDPVIEIQVVGVASTGSVARTVKVPLPPGVKPYIAFKQTVPTNGGTGSNATVTYDLVV